jgi:hypothetical protein
MEQRPVPDEPGQLAIANLPAPAGARRALDELEGSARLAQQEVAARISSTEAVELLDIRRQWLTKLVQRGLLHPIETPWGRLYDRAEVLQLAEARRIAQAGRPRRGRPRKPTDQDGEVIGTTAALPGQA